MHDFPLEIIAKPPVSSSASSKIKGLLSFFRVFFFYYLKLAANQRQFYARLILSILQALTRPPVFLKRFLSELAFLLFVLFPSIPALTVLYSQEVWGSFHATFLALGGSSLLGITTASATFPAVKTSRVDKSPEDSSPALEGPLCAPRGAL